MPTAASAFVTGPDNLVSACVEDLALDGYPNRACEQRRVWIDNACPASAVGGGTAVSAGFDPEDAALVASDRARRRARARARASGPGRRSAR